MIGVQRFVLRENIRRFQGRLAEAPDEAVRRMLQEMILTAERELALHEAARRGVREPWDTVPADTLETARAAKIAWFRDTFANAPQLAALIDPAPGLAIVEVNRAYERATDLSAAQIVGRSLFTLFPDNPQDPAANGVSNLFASLRSVAETRQAQAMALQRYDTQDADGQWRARYWRPVNSALEDDRGRLVLLLHVVEEVTDAVGSG